MVMKKTDLGLFPIDWSVSDWSSVLDGFTSGATPSRAIKDYFKGNIRWITSGELNYNTIIDTIEHISKDAVKRTNLTVHPAGTFLMAITGLEAEGTRGSCGIIGKDSTTNQSCLAIYGTPRLMIPYLFYFYVKYGDWLAKHYCQGTKQQSYTASLVKRLPIIYPPSIEEQRCITEVLSDIDSLISSLQKLIEKKKAIKQGALQELLTGKKRLPGFNEEWEELNFAESAKLKARIGWQGLTTSEYLQSGYAYLITGTDFHNGRIKWETCHFVDEKRYKQDLNIQIKKHDILLTKDGTIGKVAYISNVQKPTTLNSGVFVIRPAKEDSFDPNFVYHILNSFLFDNFLAKLSAGSTINHLYQKDFVDFTFKAPSELVEQQAIAQVLSDMDSEIDQLEKKLAKYQQIKQGMMQELLTGRIRLIGTDRGDISEV